MNARLKAQIRIALFRCAASGDFPTYEEFYKRVKGKEMKGQFPFLKHFDKIAKEERKLGYPDITFIVRRKDANSPYPSQIDFKSAKPAPNENQLRKPPQGSKRNHQPLLSRRHAKPLLGMRSHMREAKHVVRMSAAMCGVGEKSPNACSVPSMKVLSHDVV